MALNDVPQAGQTLALTQPLIRTNFSTIDSAFSVDHVSYNLSGQGKHNKVTFPVQGSTPTFLAGEVGLYNFLDPVSGVNQLYFTNAAGTTYPVTASQRQAFISGGNGYTTLPSGITLQWGTSVANANSVTVVPTIIPYTNSIMSVQLTQFTVTNVFTAVSPQLTTIAPFGFMGNTNFNVNNNGAQVQFMWFTVGF